MKDYRASPNQRKTNIVRRKLSTSFGTFPNDIFDLEISSDAKLLLIYLLNRPTDWRVLPAQLRAKLRWGRDKTYRALDELRDAGFVHRLCLARGGCVYTVFDQPTKRPENQEAARRNPFPLSRDCRRGRGYSRLIRAIYPAALSHRHHGDRESQARLTARYLEARRETPTNARWLGESFDGGSQGWSPCQSICFEYRSLLRTLY